MTQQMNKFKEFNSHTTGNLGRFDDEAQFNYFIIHFIEEREKPISNTMVFPFLVGDITFAYESSNNGSIVEIKDYKNGLYESDLKKISKTYSNIFKDNIKPIIYIQIVTTEINCPNKIFLNLSNERINFSASKDELTKPSIVDSAVRKYIDSDTTTSLNFMKEYFYMTLIKSYALIHKLNFKKDFKNKKINSTNYWKYTKRILMDFNEKYPTEEIKKIFHSFEDFIKNSQSNIEKIMSNLEQSDQINSSKTLLAIDKFLIENRYFINEVFKSEGIDYLTKKENLKFMIEYKVGPKKSDYIFEIIKKEWSYD